MNGPLAQIVALACHANAAARGVAPRFFPDNSTCRFCDRVGFDGGQRRWFRFSPAAPSAADPDEWLADLRAGGIVAARLWWSAVDHRGFADRMSAGFVGGGGAWDLETLGKDGRSAFWRAEWSVWNQKAPEQRIWRVRYRVVRTAATERRAAPTAGAAAEELRRALDEIAAFSRRRKCDPFTAAFDRAVVSLSSAERSGYHRDLAPEGILDETEARILDAVQSAYVFGGMGSWNDMASAGAEQAEYERVSERTFRAINAAIVAAVNGFASRTTA